MLFRPSENIIFMRKTDSDVVEVITQVKRILTGDVFSSLSQMIYGTSVTLSRDNQTELSTCLGNPVRGQVGLLGMGTKGSLTGKHADIVITDDIINIRDRLSRAERDFTKQIVWELQNIKNRGGRMINCGTPWHIDDAFSLMRNIVDYDCYSTGLIEKGELSQIRQSMPPSLFAANYELKHIASEDALFGASPEFFSGEDKLFQGFSHIDAAYGGADFCALTIGKRHGAEIFMLGKLRSGHIENHLSEFIELCKKYRTSPIMCEKNADKGYLAKEIISGGYRAFSYAETSNKYMKIATHLKGSFDKIRFSYETDNEYLRQILDYTEDAEHDDAPDSAACVVRRINVRKTAAKKQEEPIKKLFEIEKLLKKDNEEKII